MSPRDALSYLAKMFFAMALFAVATVTICVAVDPYWIFGTRPIAGLTEMKPRAYQRDDLAKSYLIGRTRPKTLLLGNSRIEIGMNPQSAEWPTDMRPVFNAGLAGRDLAASVDMLRTALATKEPRTIILELDFPDFLGRGAQRQTEEAPKPDTAEAANSFESSRSLEIWKDRLAATLTLDSLSDSLLTVADQSRVSSETMTAAGFNPLLPYRGLVARSGYYDLFAQKQRLYAEQYSNYSQPDYSNPRDIREFRYLIEILEMAREANCRIVIYFNPYHYQYLELLRAKELWNAFEEWKRAVLRVVDEEAQDSHDRVQVWDFSGYNQYTMERVPAPRDRKTIMQWYWESGHYKNELGELLIARMMGKPSDFGRALTADNIDTVLDEIRHSRDAYAGDIEQAGNLLRQSADTP